MRAEVINSRATEHFVGLLSLMNGKEDWEMSELEIIQLVSSMLLAVAFTLSILGIIKLTKPGAQLLVFVFSSLVVYVLGLWTWFTLIYVQTVPVDRMLREYFGIYLSAHREWYVGLLYFFSPPLLPVLAMVGVFLLRAVMLKTRVRGSETSKERRDLSA